MVLVLVVLHERIDSYLGPGISAPLDETSLHYTGYDIHLF